MNERIVVCVDGSEPSNRAVDVAVALARGLACSVEFVGVVDLQQLKGAEGLMLDEVQVVAWQREMKRAYIDDAVEAAGDVPHTRNVLQGNAARTLLDYIDSDRPRMVVVGRTGKGALEAWFMGSVSRYLAARSPVPVLVVG